MPTTLTSNPTEIPLQDNEGIPIQDNFDNNIEGTSITEERWDTNNLVTREQYIDSTEFGWDFYYGENSYKSGKIYGLDPQNSNINGYFTINEREGKFSFSSDLVDKVIILEYISDGLSTGLETRIPKWLKKQCMLILVMQLSLPDLINLNTLLIDLNKKKVLNLEMLK